MLLWIRLQPRLVNSNNVILFYRVYGKNIGHDFLLETALDETLKKHSNTRISVFLFSCRQRRIRDIVEHVWRCYAKTRVARLRLVIPCNTWDQCPVWMQPRARNSRVFGRFGGKGRLVERPVKRLTTSLTFDTLTRRNMRKWIVTQDLSISETSARIPFFYVPRNPFSRSLNTIKLFNNLCNINADKKNFSILKISR